VLVLALDLGKLTTRKGAKIEVHFENISDESKLKQQYSHSEFLEELNNNIDQWGNDNGHDTVHLLINNQAMVATLTESDYNEWQNAPEKEWFHRPSINFIFFGDLSDSDIMEEPFLYSSNIQPENDSKFVGMPKEEFDEFFADPKNLENLKAIHKAYPECCRFCPIPKCPGRETDFDRSAYEYAITGLQITTAKE